MTATTAVRTGPAAVPAMHASNSHARPDVERSRARRDILPRSFVQLVPRATRVASRPRRPNVMMQGHLTSDLVPYAAWLILAAWVGVAVGLVGIGALVRRLCGRPARSADDWLAGFWLGFA